MREKEGREMRDNKKERESERETGEGERVCEDPDGYVETDS